MEAKSISILLKQAKEGSDEARETLFVKLHEQLSAYAIGLLKQERDGHTLQPTALINEACVRLLESGVVDNADNRRQLFYAATRAMRQVLVDHARSRASKKRGGDFVRQPLDLVIEQFEEKHQASFLDLADALERLREESPREYEVLSLRFFAGLTIQETAHLLECSAATVESDWRFARAKLVSWLGSSGSD